MAYYEDLTPYAYDKNNENGKAVNVGWLESGHDFTRGETPPEVLDALTHWPITNTYRGWHSCPFCDGRRMTGNGDKRVTGQDGVVYVAPVLMTHYIRDHDYRPPQAFIDAVISRISKAGNQ